MSDAAQAAVSFSPGNKTYATMKAEVARYVLMPDDDEAKTIAGEGITDAIRKLNHRVWYWNLDINEITLSANDTEYDGPSDFHLPRSAYFLDTSDKPQERIGWVDPKIFDDVRSTNTGILTNENTPRTYTIFRFRTDKQVSFDGNITSSLVAQYPKVRLVYFKFINYPTSDGGVIGVPAHVESFILWYAKHYTAGIVAPQKVQLALANMQDCWKELVRDNTKSQTTDWV